MPESKNECPLGPERDPQRVNVAYGLYCVAAVAALVAAYIGLHNLALHTKTPQPNGKTTIVAVYDEPELTKDLVANDLIPFVVTSLAMTPPERVIMPDSVIVAVDASQRRVALNTKTHEVTEEGDLTRLSNPIDMVLESSDFDFPANGNERIYSQGAIAPFTAAWTPAPRKAGKLHLLLRLRNIKNVRLVVNGVPQTKSGNSDIAIPVDVLETSGLTPWQQTWFFWIISGISGISGVGGWIAHWLSRQKRHVSTARKRTR